MMTKESTEQTKRLIEFIEESPTAFHAVESISARLIGEGFSPLQEADEWPLEAGKGYFVTKNQSSIIAFRIPKGAPKSILLAASHTDSPMLKLKSEPIAPAFDRYLRLNVECYGGTILSTWLDRPLSLAGRVIVKTEDGRFVPRLVKFDRDLLLIPNVSIHFNRTVNSGYAYNPAVDMLPLFSQESDKKDLLKALLAKELGCSEESIVQSDLFVYNRTEGSIWGADGEFFSSPRIDNLMCAFGTLQGFCNASTKDTLAVYFAADNEETGSATKQGADSVFLSDVLDRICTSFGWDKKRLLASSMAVSADNGHAKHPNHPELSDAQNAPHLNRGVVIKYNAAQKYATDSLSAALFEEVCHRAEVPVQRFANRSDMAGGSTLGSISSTWVPMITVDIGMAQLAMHSAYESAGVADTDFLCRAMKTFFESELTVLQDGSYRLD